jgi:hypothetical protein
MIMGLHVELTKNEVRKDYVICIVVLNLELYTNIQTMSRKTQSVSFAYIAEVHIFHHLNGIATNWGKQ